MKQIDKGQWIKQQILNIDKNSLDSIPRDQSCEINVISLYKFSMAAQ